MNLKNSYWVNKAGLSIQFERSTHIRIAKGIKDCGNMRNQAILLIAFTLIILACINSTYAEDTQNVSIQNDSNLNNTINSTQTNSSYENPKNTVISGKVTDCNTNSSFPGVNVTISNNGSYIASNLTNDDGSYIITFLSDYTEFNVTASHIGHNSVTKEITTSSATGSNRYGSANFELGNIYVNINTGNDNWDGTSPTHTSGNTGPFKTIQKGIDTLNHDKGGTLYIANGTYTISDELTIEYNSYIYGTDMNSTIIDGNNKTRILKINSGIKVTIANLTIMNGKGDNDGGGVYNEGTLTLDTCNIYNNIADDGRDADFTHHATDGGNGGGIYNEGTLYLQNSLIHDNSAGQGGDGTEIHSPGSGGNGGGIYNKGTLTITNNCQIYNNIAGEGGKGASGGENPSGGEGGNGGAIYNDDGTLTITGTSTNMIQIYNNNAGLGGESPSFENTGGDGGKAGGIYNKKYCTITYANIYNNIGGKGNTYTGSSDHGDINGGDGGDGGAFYNEGTLNLIGCIITNNQAGPGCNGNRGGDGGNGGNGGAIANTGALNITNCQISNNAAGNAGKGGDEYYYSEWKSTYDGGDGGLGGSGGAIYNTGTLTITGSSITQNTAGNGGNGGKGAAEDIKDHDHDEIEIEDPGDGGNGGSGGGIYNSGTLNSITNSHIDNNTAGNGGNGGLYTDDIDLDLWYKVEPADAGIGGSGGGIYSEGTLTSITNTTINNNAAGNGGNGNPVSRYTAENGGSGGNGGGLVLYHSITIANCQISNNKAGNGGKGGNTSTQGDEPSTSPGNGGNAGSGGGIYYYYEDNDNQRTIAISNSTFDNNSAGTGGAGGIDDDQQKDKSNGGNGGNGGAIAIISKTIAKSASYNLQLNIHESTITNNKAGTGGQPYLTGTSSNGVGGGLYSNDNHYFTVDFCRILNNTPQAIYLSLSSSNPYTHLYNNWWGSNNAPSNQITGNNIDSSYYTPWIVLSINANPISIYTGQNSNIVTNLIMNSNGDNTLLDWAMYVPDGIPVAFSTSAGSVNPQNSATTTGASNTVFTANSAAGTALVYATVDNQIVNTAIQILPSSDIGVTKTVNNTMPNVGDKITFTVTVRNNGMDDATNIQIMDIMPGGFNNAVITPSIGTYDSATGIWTIPALANGAIATLTMNGTVTGDLAGKTTTNNATKIHQDQVDPNPNNDKASVSIYVPMADVYIAKTVNNNNPNVGDTVIFTVTVINDGPDNATNIQISDTMPAGFNNVIITPSTGTYDSTTGIWTIPNLANGASATLTLSGIVTPANAGQIITNTATKTHEDQYDPTPDDDTASASTNVQEADIGITKTVDKQRANVGEKVTFTITVTNKGPNGATGLIFIDKLPVGLQYDSAAADKGSLSHVGNYILWNLGDLNNGQTVTLTINATVISPGNLTNIARKIHEDQYDPDIDSANATVYAPEADVTITNTPNQSNVNVGNTATFTVTVHNNGPDTATGVVINDVIPQGFTAHASKGTVTNGVWTIGTLEKNEEATLTLTRIITPQWAGKTIYNNASETQNEYNANPQTVSANIYVPQADVSIIKVARNIHFDLNDTVRFLIILENHGPDEATGIQVIDSLPNDLEFVSASDGGIYDPVSRAITWNLDNLADGLYKALILQTKVNANISSNIITNTAMQSQNEYNNEAKTSNATITINKADLYLTSTSSNPNPKAGDNLTITFKLGNKGPDTAKNVIVTIPIPEGFEYISANVDQGTCSYDPSTRTVTWNVGDVPFGDPYLYLNLKAITEGHYVINSIITTTTYDPNLENIIFPLYVNITSNNGENTVNAASKTIGMQKTGLPIAGLILAVLMVLGGLGSSRRK